MLSQTYVGRVPIRLGSINKNQEDTPDTFQNKEPQCSGVGASNCENVVRNSMLMQFINQMVAVAFEMKSEDLFATHRGDARTSRARQISMYLMNTGLGSTFMDIGKFYNRDRTTVRHACAVIEELRDIPQFDDRMEAFEQTFSTVLDLAQIVPQGISS